MQPDPNNPLSLIAWVIAVFIGAPGFVLLVKGIFFIATASKDLQTVVKYVHDRRSIESVTEITLTLMENDITGLQEHQNLPTHPWPERRSGNDRRTA